MERHFNAALFRMKKITVNRQMIEIELPKELIFQLAMMAHEEDITLNELINRVLRQMMNEPKVKEKIAK